MVTIEQLPPCLVFPEHLFASLYGMSVMPLCKCCCLSTFRPLMVSIYLQRIADGFASKWRFPQCVGVINGSVSPSCHPWTAQLTITIGFHSIVLQAVVDHEYRFWIINVGWPWRVHDAHAFTNSELFEKAQEGTLLPSFPRLIHGVNVPLLIVGDLPICCLG